MVATYVWSAQRQLGKAHACVLLKCCLCLYMHMRDLYIAYVAIYVYYYNLPICDDIGLVPKKGYYSKQNRYYMQ